MEKQKNWEDLLEWASASDDNRKEAIIEASQFIYLLSSSFNKKPTKEELKSLFGGKLFT
jgi:hypothetical protein